MNEWRAAADHNSLVRDGPDRPGGDRVSGDSPPYFHRGGGDVDPGHARAVCGFRACGSPPPRLPGLVGAARRLRCRARRHGAGKQRTPANRPPPAGLGNLIPRPDRGSSGAASGRQSSPPWRPLRAVLGGLGRPKGPDPFGAVLTSDDGCDVVRWRAAACDENALLRAGRIPWSSATMSWWSRTAHWLKRHPGRGCGCFLARGLAVSLAPIWAMGQRGPDPQASSVNTRPVPPSTMGGGGGARSRIGWVRSNPVPDLPPVQH